MPKNFSVSMSSVKGNDSEYIIRDNIGITVGRAFVIELARESGWCSVRIKIYKQDQEGHDYLKDTLILLLSTLFKNMRMHKVNIIVDEDVNTAVFIDLGFQLEGIYTQSIKSGNFYKDEFIFGIECEAYEDGIRQVPLVLRGKNIELRVLTPGDAKEVTNYYNNNREHLKSFEPSRDESFYTLEAQKRSLIESYKQYLNGTSINFGLYKHEVFIGKLQISNIIMGVFRSAFIGYSIDKDFQGKGYMKEALRLALDYAYEDIGLHRVEASTLIDNVRSQGVLKACGFNELGVNKNYLFIDGEWRDHITFYKTFEELKK